jgi:type 1 fimbriae regulatory protein FimB/type 1 fimbriae regulatory protein FimE
LFDHDQIKWRDITHRSAIHGAQRTGANLSVSVQLPASQPRNLEKISMNTGLQNPNPSRENRQVDLRRVKNLELRGREYLTPDEIEKLIKAAKASRNAHRDATIVLMVYRHGLRASEAVALEWSQLTLDTRAPMLQVRRVKNGNSNPIHVVRGDEQRALRQLRREQEPKSPFVFTTERGGPFTPDAINNLIKALGRKAELPFPIHCHMLRHSCGYALANAGHDTRRIQDWLGHKCIEHTVRYTSAAPNQFEAFWR